MSQDKQSLMEQMYEKTFRDIKEGEIVKGKIVAFNEKEAVVDIGFKSEGFVSVDEFRNIDNLAIDTEIEVLIESIEDEDGRLILSRQKAEKLHPIPIQVCNCHHYLLVLAHPHHSVLQSRPIGHCIPYNKYWHSV